MKINAQFKHYKFFSLGFFLCISSFVFSQNCGAGDVALYSQLQVDTFVATYSGTCNTVDGDLRIEYSPDIVDLSGLSFLTTINGDMFISFNPFTDLTGLDNITTIGGDLNISNTILTNIDPFLNLTSVGGELNLDDNQLFRKHRWFYQI